MKQLSLNMSVFNAATCKLLNEIAKIGKAYSLPLSLMDNLK